MLSIKQVRKYGVARYPRGSYSRPPELLPVELLRNGITAAALTLLVDACTTSTTTSGPPPPRGLVTEAEARQVIDRVFSDNNVTLKHDFELHVQRGGADSIRVNLDGYNDSLRVGYEYICNDDDLTFTDDVVQTLDSARVHSGPYIKTIGEIDRQTADYQILIQNTQQEFLDTLRAHGII